MKNKQTNKDNEDENRFFFVLTVCSNLLSQQIFPQVERLCCFQTKYCKGNLSPEVSQD